MKPAPSQQRLNSLLSRLRMKQLQLLIALDEHQSLHKASSALAMTQSAASKSLAELEAMLDAQLFERTRSGLIPNQFGHCVIRYARLMATDLGSLCEEMAQIRSGRGGRLAIGAVMGALPELVVPAVDALQRRHPELSIDIVEQTSRQLLSLLDEGHLDLLVARASVSDNPGKYHYQPLSEEPLSVVVSGEHPRPRGRQMRLAALAGYRWVTYPSHMPLHAVLEREMDLAGVSMPGNAISTASTFVTVALLQQGTDMVSILPTAVAEMFVRRGMLRILPVKLRSMSQTIGIVTRKGGQLSRAGEAFVGLLRQEASAV
ncbi:LysR family transcription regulator protein [Herbaspirillum sp. GW103]|uniref:LysR family transcriptional regulator n=1 Tax=unclassified Herbaspirillum TaxID=2624150 RepID=UPI00025E387C|nr:MULTISPECIES: LysR family transcriptional regulator [unclassified Herbaspirillum]EIJ46530.1 LysR family transcription regulator protein [Herbaspirillum sp. GW103]MCI1003768.1 LysR family transcriptional regulator [Herbaspirillum sp. C7C8]NUT62760.1 LysR family transcriptional regulator [Herbaspirillum sp. C9C3]